MPWQPDATLAARLDDLIEDRTRTFRQHSRERLRTIELRHSMRGNAMTAEAANELRAALRETFMQYADSLTSDLLAAVTRKDGTVANETATWIRQRVDPTFVSTLQGVVDAVQGGSPNAGASAAEFQQQAETMIGDARRKLAIAIGRVTERRRGSGSPVASSPDLASIDDLVRLRNRRAFTADFARMLAEAAAAVEPLSLVRIDVDHFKNVNDRHGGHAVGDEALVAVGGVLDACVRGKGYAYRVGGDEFVLLLPNHAADEAAAVAERVRRTVNDRRVTSRALQLSVSVGVATYPDHATTAAELEQAADKASYDAKDRGRNLVRVFGD